MSSIPAYSLTRTGPGEPGTWRHVAKSASGETLCLVDATSWNEARELADAALSEKADDAAPPSQD